MRWRRACPVFVLTVGLGLGLLTLNGRSSDAVPSGPMPGEVVPDLLVRRIDSDGAATGLQHALADVSHTGCKLLVLVSTSCTQCGRMRITWRDRFLEWRHEVGIPIHPIWLAEEHHSEFRQFLQSADLGGVTLLANAGPRWSLFRSLGVVGTPTSYLVGAESKVLSGVAGDYFPRVGQTQRACAL